ncbi:arsenate reductase ArsC [Pelolinea submarina]|uniref:Arsenate reductase n=1 Tax=Pelolinea submarina TaxID=913107 RepID=A0A347ZQ08_9CHLR|nr:arsenate reductase ArsC [Pelolinea submarina]REG06282.1 arsenate reductase [Pelolinea submarina]BBB47389.1 arsenate reductase [Pelolinea submarina]
MEKPRVLFLCTGNSARSQMAEALLRKMAGNHFEVHSAGLEPTVIHPMTIKVLEEIGIDASQQYAKPLTTYLGKTQFSYLVTVCSKAEERCPFFPGMGQRLHWPFEDPAAFEGNDKEKLDYFRTIRDQIQARIQQWLSELNIS